MDQVPAGVFDGPLAREGLLGKLKYHCFAVHHSTPPVTRRSLSHYLTACTAGLLQSGPPSLASQVVAVCASVFGAVQLFALLLRPEFGFYESAFGAADFVLTRGAPSDTFHTAFVVIVAVALLLVALGACVVFVLMKGERGGPAAMTLVFLLRWLCAIVLDVLFVPVLVILLIPLSCSRVYAYARCACRAARRRMGCTALHCSGVRAALTRACPAETPKMLRARLRRRYLCCCLCRLPP